MITRRKYSGDEIKEFDELKIKISIHAALRVYVLTPVTS